MEEIHEGQELEPKEPANPFNFLINSQLAIEKLRVAAQVRQSHLKLKDRVDLDTDDLVERLQALEDYIDNKVAEKIVDHPAYPWFSRVKGIGRENIGKVVGFIDIQEADTVSSLWKFSGYHVVNGKAPKREKGGGKLEYNSRLRSMCWRVGTSLMKGGGKFYEYYVQEKTKLLSRYSTEGIKVVKATELPKDKSGKRHEPEGIISEGHVHNQALRKMVKLFLSCLWQAWREAEDLPVRSPYVIEMFPEHTHFISCWDMVDRPAKVSRRRRA